MYVPFTILYLYTYICRAVGLSKNLTSGSFLFRVHKFQVDFTELNLCSPD